MQIFNQGRLEDKPDIILIDLDDTLYDYETAHSEGLEGVKKKVELSLSIDQDILEETFSKARYETKTRLGETASSHSRILYFQRMIELFGLGTQIDLTLDLEQTYWRNFFLKMLLFEDAREFLEDVKLLDIKLCLITDLTAHIQYRKLIHLGLERYFDFIVTSEETGADKPHKANFLLAMAKLESSSNHVWMIGDDPIKDIKGSREAISSVAIQKIHRGKALGIGDARPDAAFRNFSEIRQLLHEVAGKKEGYG